MKRFRMHRDGTESVLTYQAFGDGACFGFIAFPSDATSLVDFIADDCRRLRFIDDVADAVNATFSDDDRETLQTIGDLLDLTERLAVQPAMVDVFSAIDRATSDGQAHA